MGLKMGGFNLEQVKTDNITLSINAQMWQVEATAVFWPMVMNDYPPLHFIQTKSNEIIFLI